MRRILVFTGTRADYGLLKGLVLAVHRSAEAELSLIVSGTHLDPDFGSTSDEIREDGIPIAAEIPIWSGDDSAVSAADDVGRAIGVYARTLHELAPDVVVLLGDRLEAFAMATAATIQSVPIAHIHGGEVTTGAMDDSLRHAITKLSYLHLTSTDAHRSRVIQLGEDPERVLNLGAPIVDALAASDLLDAAEIEHRYPVAVTEPFALMTFHPAAMDVRPPLELLEETLGALDRNPMLRVVITGTNSDIGGASIRARISDFVDAHPERVDYVESFGQLGYLSVMKQAAVVLGNSSSVVLEAPVLGVPSVLVGIRQSGRPLASSVLVPQPNREAIATAIRDATADAFRQKAEGLPTPFGRPGFAERALCTLLGELPERPHKTFHDLGRIAS